MLSYALAGALVVSCTLLMFWRAHVVGVFEAIGLAMPADGRWLRAILLGVALGLGAGVFAFFYLLAIQHIPGIERYRQQAEEMTMVRRGWLVFLAVIAAPLFEEFIFRGLVFRGMRRSLPARWSIAGSAAVFAICHPLISVAPVFVMAAIAALGFEITGWIVTPICAHMVYNGLVLLAGLLQHGGRM